MGSAGPIRLALAEAEAEAAEGGRSNYLGRRHPLLVLGMLDELSV